MKKQGHEQARSSCRWALPFQFHLFWNISTERLSLTWLSFLDHFPVKFLVAMPVCQSLLPVWTPSTCRLFCRRCRLLHSTFFWRFSSSTKTFLSAWCCQRYGAGTRTISIPRASQIWFNYICCLWEQALPALFSGLCEAAGSLAVTFKYASDNDV